MWRFLPHDEKEPDITFDNFFLSINNGTDMTSADFMVIDRFTSVFGH